MPNDAQENCFQKEY